MDLTLRPATEDDRAFAERIYFEAHRWIIEQLFGWRGDDVERERFTRSYKQAQTAIVLADGNEAGWLTVDREPESITLDQIYLASQWRNRGIGTKLLDDLKTEARAAGVPVRLSTAKINPALRLYERLGFRVTSESLYKVYLEWRPREC